MLLPFAIGAPLLLAGAGIALGVPGVSPAAALVGASEIGDKTFFLSAVIAMRQGRSVAYVGSMSALTTLTAASVALGASCRHLPDDLLSPFGLPLVDIIATSAFTYFGVQMLREASAAEAAAAEESREAEQEATDALAKAAPGSFGAMAAAFSLVFMAEIGDKSMLTTIALAKELSASGVLLGALAGHTAATGLAVVGGSSLSGRLSQSTVCKVGGVLFLLFACATGAKAAGLIEEDWFF